ncbi:MAG: NAD(P)H-dependent oxidoreductase [Lachnospiraceae bacterium]|nr:NAD(P)H-dependent oxidoreductase [Lachnospiraceae bacterium]
MRILILNGSPAGDNSITLQHMEYLKKKFPRYEYKTINVAARIRSIEKDFTQSKEELESADLIVFCYPVYTFLIPAQLHRFIELIKENGVDLSGKYATQVSTSKHFYDTTAHRFIEENCYDLKLRYVKGLSADMEDILSKKGQKEAVEFFKFVLWNMKNNLCDDLHMKEASSAKLFEAGSAKKSTKKTDKTIALVTDYDDDKSYDNLRSMIARFVLRFPGDVNVINLREFPFIGGCLGCFNCASDGKCIYKDGFDDYLRKNINGADAVVYAYSIKDHSMGYRFKLYDDRQFCNGHRTVTMGKPVAYLIDGHLSVENNLMILMEARAQVGGNFLAGVVSNESNPDEAIDNTVKTLYYALKHSYNPPKNFYGVGGLKIFRDLIYQMQGLMKEDHRFYKEHGFYDFPQKHKGRIMGMYLVSALMNNKKISKKVSMTDGMMMMYKKVIDEA